MRGGWEKNKKIVKRTFAWFRAICGATDTFSSLSSAKNEKSKKHMPLLTFSAKNTGRAGRHWGGINTLYELTNVCMNSEEGGRGRSKNNTTFLFFLVWNYVNIEPVYWLAWKWRVESSVALRFYSVFTIFLCHDFPQLQPVFCHFAQLRIALQSILISQLRLSCNLNAGCI